MFFYEFYEISKSTFFAEHLQLNTSENYISLWLNSKWWQMVSNDKVYNWTSNETLRRTRIYINKIAVGNWNLKLPWYFKMGKWKPEDLWGRQNWIQED